MAPVAGGVDQHVGRGRSHRAVQNGFERLVAGLAIVKAQVIAKDDEFLGPPGHHVHDVGQIDQIGLVHFNQPQALGRKSVQAGFDEGGFAGAARAGQQHVVGAAPGHKLRGVALDFFFLRVDLFQVVQRHAAHVAHRLQRAMAAAALAVAPGNGSGPVGRRQRLRQHRFNARDELLGPQQQMFKILVHFGLKGLLVKRKQLSNQER